MFSYEFGAREGVDFEVCGDEILFHRFRLVWVLQETRNLVTELDLVKLFVEIFGFSLRFGILLRFLYSARLMGENLTEHVFLNISII